ncbi:hypothetical protein Dxin01_00763 [Deinococcus xinjiangensis]|uniref:Uncharacterized protein n=1 Tax=Deinococcus xinjiangensis TaxID=457454 RepID=A0ABP9V6X8_9DEIO
MLDVIRRPFGFASSIVKEARTFTVNGDVSPQVEQVLKDQLQLTRDVVREQYQPLSQTDTVWLAGIIKTWKEVQMAWSEVWESTPPYLLKLACLDWYKHVHKWNTEGLASVETLWKFAAPIALQVAVEAAPQFGGWNEAFSFVSANGLDVIRRWKPQGGIGFLKYFEESSRAELPKGLSILRGRGQQLDQRLRTIWAARSNLLAYSVDAAMITPSLVLREIEAQHKAKDEPMPAFWTLKLVTELLESQQYAPMWSLDYKGEEDDRVYGDTLSDNGDLGIKTEVKVMHWEARKAARALAKAGLWEVAMSIPLDELLKVAEEGTHALTVYCEAYDLQQEDAIEIVSTIGHLTLWAD